MSYELAGEIGVLDNEDMKNNRKLISDKDKKDDKRNKKQHEMKKYERKIFVDQKYIVITNNNFSDPMEKKDAIKAVKEYDKKGVTGYIVSEEEAKRIKNPSNFNEPKWN